MQATLLLLVVILFSTGWAFDAVSELPGWRFSVITAKNKSNSEEQYFRIAVQDLSKGIAQNSTLHYSPEYISTVVNQYSWVQLAPHTSKNILFVSNGATLLTFQYSNSGVKVVNNCTMPLTVVDNFVFDPLSNSLITQTAFTGFGIQLVNPYNCSSIKLDIPNTFMGTRPSKHNRT